MNYIIRRTPKHLILIVVATMLKHGKHVKSHVYEVPCIKPLIRISVTSKSIIGEVL